MAARKALTNQLRAIQLERGHVFRQGRVILERAIDGLLTEPPADLSTRMLALVAEMRGERREMDARIDGLNRDLAAQARADDVSRAGWFPRPASACSEPRRWWPPSAMATHSAARGICPPGSASFQSR